MRKILKKLILHAALFVMPFQLSASNDDDPCDPCKEWDSASKTCDNVPDGKECCGGFPIPQGFECCNGKIFNPNIGETCCGGKKVCKECQYCDEVTGECLNHRDGYICNFGTCCGGTCIDTNIFQCCNSIPASLDLRCCSRNDDCPDCHECFESAVCVDITKEITCSARLNENKETLQELGWKVVRPNGIIVEQYTNICKGTGLWGVPVVRRAREVKNKYWYEWQTIPKSCETCGELPPNQPDKIEEELYGDEHLDVHNMEFIRCKNIHST